MIRQLHLQIESLKNSDTFPLLQSRLKEFKSFSSRTDEEWFGELCYCILAANSKAKTSFAIQQELGSNGFLNFSRAKILFTLKKHHHRFHNNKTNFLVEARKHHPLKNKIQQLIQTENASAAREWLAENVKGFGLKEASHFLRNVGVFDFAVLDRHILNVMLEHKLIQEIPTSLTPKKYFEIEQKFIKTAQKFNLAPGELDYYLWAMRSNQTLK